MLLIRPSAVGDVIMVLPSLEALRHSFPQAYIGFIVEDRAQDLIVGHPSVDRVHLFPRKSWKRAARQPKRWANVWREVGKFAEEIRKERYDISVDFQGNLKGSLLGLIGGARRRLGYSSVYSRELNHLFTNVHVTPAPGDIHRAEKFQSLVRFLGAQTAYADYRLPDSADSRRRVQEFLRAHELSKYAVIHPGTSDFGRAKRWSPDRFSAVARNLGGLGLSVVVAWGPGEQALAEQIAADSAGNAIVSLETQSILDLAELLREATIFVGCDSGPMHLCSAVNTPAVVIFGPHNPEIYGPFKHPHVRLVHKRRNGVGRTDWVTAEDVNEAVVELLQKVSAPRL
ncbi:MAG: glycosyltransferase family 9 protein [SAR324 cluster bacterium]|nr:glycosyltransferase family 9 protein [SAR324 cluster bacterium]